MILYKSSHVGEFQFHALDNISYQMAGHFLPVGSNLPYGARLLTAACYILSSIVPQLLANSTILGKGSSPFISGCCPKGNTWSSQGNSQIEESEAMEALNATETDTKKCHLTLTWHAILAFYYNVYVWSSTKYRFETNAIL